MSILPDDNEHILGLYSKSCSMCLWKDTEIAQLKAVVQTLRDEAEAALRYYDTTPGTVHVNKTPRFTPSAARRILQITQEAG